MPAPTFSTNISVATDCSTNSWRILLSMRGSKAGQTRATIYQTKRRWGDVERAERDGIHPKLFFFWVLVIFSQGLRHCIEVNGGPIHKMALLLFQSPIQVFGELAQGRREGQCLREREREGETHHPLPMPRTRSQRGQPRIQSESPPKTHQTASPICKNKSSRRAS